MALPWILLVLVLVSLLSTMAWALARQNRAMEELMALEDKGLFFTRAWRMMKRFPGPFWGKSDGPDPAAAADGEQGGGRKGRRAKAVMPGFSPEECVRRFRKHYLSGVRRYARAGVLAVTASILLPAALLLARSSGREMLWGSSANIFVSVCIAVLILALIISIALQLRRATELIFKVEGKMALMLEPALDDPPLPGA